MSGWWLGGMICVSVICIIVLIYQKLILSFCFSGLYNAVGFVVFFLQKMGFCALLYDRKYEKVADFCGF